MQPQIRSVTAVFCFNSAGEVLVIRKRSGEYGYPGGRVDENEDADASATRELTEETGLTLPVRYMATYRLPPKVKQKKNKETGAVVSIMRQKRMRAYIAFADATKPAPIDLHEIDRAAYVTPKEAARLIPSLIPLLDTAVSLHAAMTQSPMRLSA